MSLPELRKAVPAKYPIRDYPDITHSLRCQYPVPDWDVAYSLTEGREVINPRPRDESTIFHAFADQTIGFITYSEGCNDDVNKIVWSALGWDPDADVLDVLRQYGRYLIGLGDRRRRRLCPGALRPGAELARAALDQRLGRDDARSSSASMERSVTRRRCWRTGGSSRRSIAPITTPYVRSRLIYETDLEEQALATAARARATRVAGGDGPGRERSSTGRSPSRSPPICGRRVFELAEALFQSIRMQLSVPRYKAIAVGRGATLDTIDVPLNNRIWLKQRFAAIRDARAARKRGSREIDAIVNWTNPGPGGFYDDLGDPHRRPHLVSGSCLSTRTRLAPRADDGLRPGPQLAALLVPARRDACRPAASDALHRPRPGRRLQGPRRLHRRHVPGESAAHGQRLDRGASLPRSSRRDMTPLEFDIPREATRTGVARPELARRVGPRRQRPRLPGEPRCG